MFAEVFIFEKISCTRPGSLSVILDRMFSNNTVCTCCSNKQCLSIKLQIFSYTLVFTYVLGAQKHFLIDSVLMSTRNMFWLRDIFFVHTPN